MATNELAAILARRRAKAGGESASAAPAVEESAPPAGKTAPSAAKSSIAERIARLKQQSAAAAEAAPAPACSQSETSLEPAAVGTGQEDGSGCTAAASEGVDTSAVAAAQEAAGLRRASSKIQQLQGSLGINVNPFGRPSGPVKSGGSRQPVGYQRESIMSTGEEQYGHTKHAMGVAMPGMMGSAIPMPGLTKREFRLPGLAVEGEQSAEASSAALDNSHTTMNRVAGPKRRGPMRPPPGAFRIPAMTVPRTNDVEPDAVAAAEPAVVVASALAQDAKPEAREYVAMGSLPSSVLAKAARSPATVYAPVSMHTLTPSTSVPAPVAAADLQKLPEPEPLLPMKPYEIQDDPFAPTYEAPAELPDAPAGFPSALMANFSMDELVVTDQPEPKPSAPSSLHSTPASSSFGATSGPAPTSRVAQKPFAPVPAESAETPLPAPAVTTPASNLERPASSVIATPALVLETPASPVLVPAPAPVMSSPTPTSVPVYASTPTLLTAVPAATPEPALVSTPTPAVAAVPAGPVLFGAAASAASDDDNSSESDWSDGDDDDDDNGGQSLFGGKTAAAKPETMSSSPTLVTPTQSTPECHHAPALSGGNLFGDPSSTSAFVPAAATPGFVQAAPQTTIPPAPYSSLFGGAASSSSESDSDSDDEGGLFGT
uniref:Uncharacterized protein n=1 Tax=Peronospora matthiolae TaxID=2874970 RepID=A0AAV1UJ57_9STRA